jgi:hypothetical protein
MNRLIRIAAMLLTFAVGLSSGTAFAEPSYGCQRQGAGSIPLVELEVAGDGELCVLRDRVQGELIIRNLVPGNAYTVWLVYFDDPVQCTGGTVLPVPLAASSCDLFDFEGVKPLAVFGRMASGVATQNGRLNLSGRLGGMRPSSGSEFWMLVFGHGPAATGAALARQLLTPEDPNAGAPHLGNIEDGLLGYPIASAVFVVE